MKNSILLIAVASVFALASCGGEKHAETSNVETVNTIDSNAVVVDSSSTMTSDSSSTMSVDSSVTK